MSTRSTLKTIAFSLVPVAVLLLLLEVAGRWLYPFDPDERAMIITKRDPRVALSYFDSKPGAEAILWDVNRMERRYLAFLGFLGKPNTTLPTIRTNQLGFRDDAPAPRQPGEVRVLVLGGSTSWSLGASSNDATVRGALQRLLNQRADARYRVMSGAFLGYAARQEMTVLTEFLDAFDPDVIVSLTGHNDVMSIMHDTGGVLQRWEARTLEEAVANQLKPMDTLTALRKLAGSLGIWRLVVYVKEQSSGGPGQGGVVTYDGDRSERLSTQVAEFHRISADYAKRHGRRYVVVMQPDLYSTSKALSPEELEVKNRFISISRGADSVYPRYRKDLSARLSVLEGTEFLDLRDRFDDVKEALFIDDCHLVDRGYELIAEAIAPAIR